MNPTVGRIVHVFKAPGAAPEAAIITRVWDEKKVNVTVFLDTFGDIRDGAAATRHVREVPQLECTEGQVNENQSYPRWDWPERV